MTVVAGAGEHAAHRLHEVGELHGEDELGGGAVAQALEGFQVLEAHRLAVDRLGDGEDAVERLGEAVRFEYLGLLMGLGAEDLGLAVALGAEDLGLLLAFGDGDGGDARPFGLNDGGSALSFCRHLAVHRSLNVARRGDLPNFHRGYLDSPAHRDLVELHPQGVVDLLTLGEHVVESDVADDGAERRDRHALHRADEVLHLDYRPLGFALHHAQVDEEVDVDGGVVPRDGGLARDGDEPLAQVYLACPRVNERPQPTNPWMPKLDEPSEP